MHRWVVILARIDVLSCEGCSQLIAAQAIGLGIDGDRKVLVGAAVARAYLLEADAGEGS